MPLILGLIDIALVVKLLEYALHALHMMLVGGADKAVVGDIHELPQLFEAGGYLIRVLLRGHIRFRGVAFYLLTVFVGTGQEKHLVPGHSLIAGERVGIDGAVGVPDMRVGAGVIDRRCDVILAVHRCDPLPLL